MKQYQSMLNMSYLYLSNISEEIYVPCKGFKNDRIDHNAIINFLHKPVVWESETLQTDNIFYEKHLPSHNNGFHEIGLAIT